MDMDSSRVFYDELADQYHLIFEDWEASMHRQGQAISSLFVRYLPESSNPIRVLDVAAGIGTQSLPLSRMGCQVSSRDLSSGAIARLAREAALRGLSVDAQVSDMRTVQTSVTGLFDAVIAFDNSVPHLLSDADILSAFRAFYACLRPGGVCLLSVRDYERVTPGADSVHAYGVRWREGTRHLPFAGLALGRPELLRPHVLRHRR
jgi:2-polyprenyl-3-methyl-5-hydroxy-6-metoxy-1,4-benzoquinol methylase